MYNNPFGRSSLTYILLVYTYYQLTFDDLITAGGGGVSSVIVDAVKRPIHSSLISVNQKA